MAVLWHLVLVDSSSGGEPFPALPDPPRAIIATATFYVALAGELAAIGLP